MPTDPRSDASDRGKTTTARGWRSRRLAEVAPHRPWNQAGRTEPKNQDYQRGVQQVSVLLEDLKLLRQENDEKCCQPQTPRVSDSAQQDDRDQGEGLGKGEVVGSQKAHNEGGQCAGHPNQKITEGECEDLPSRNLQAEGCGADLVEPNRIQSQAEPGGFQPLHQKECERKQGQGEQHVVEIERSVQWTHRQLVVELKPEDLQPTELQPLRTTERVVHLDEGAEQKSKRNCDQRGIVPPRAQQRQKQQ